MSILASEALLCENKKSSDKMLPSVSIEPLIPNSTLFSGLTCYL